MRKQIIRYLRDADYRFYKNAVRGAHRSVPDEEYLRRVFKGKMGYPLNLDDPQTFNEKLQWLKLYDRQPEHTMMVDKYAVKKYVAQILGEELIIPTIGVWESVEDIDFAALPNSFVIKCTHDSHGLVVCKDKSRLDVAAAKKKLRKAMRRNYYPLFREWPYRDVKPRIIAEAYMEDSQTRDLRDYKFFCFNGVVRCYKVDFDRFIEHHANYYDPDGNILDFGEVVCPPQFDREILLPENIRTMIQYAETLARGQTFVRVDFYDVDGRIYFGEITFFPAAGLGRITPPEWDAKLGAMMKLPDHKIM